MQRFHGQSVDTTEFKKRVSCGQFGTPRNNVYNGALGVEILNPSHLEFVSQGVSQLSILVFKRGAYLPAVRTMCEFFIL